MFAVVSIGSKQYKVAQGDVLTVPRLPGKVGKALTFDRVLLISKGDQTKIGSPTVKGAKVTAKILGEEKGPKLDVYRFKSKVRFRRHTGFRPLLTRLEIVAISQA